MTREEILEILSAHPLIGRMPTEERAWLAAHGEIRSYQPDELVTPHTAPIAGMYVILDGGFSMHVNRGGGWRKLLHTTPGEIVGVVPYSRAMMPPGDTTANGFTTVFFLSRADVPSLIHACPVLTTELVHLMLDRARMFMSNDLHDDKMMSLGKLAAGFAHELNNPASAAARDAVVLAESLARAERAAENLGAAQLSADQQSAFDEIKIVCAKEPARTPLEIADREEEFTARLSASGVDAGVSEVLARSGVSSEQLDALIKTFNKETLNVVMSSIAVDLTVRNLSREIVTATSRIRDLVSSMKGFTYMDRAPVPEAVDVTAGLADTINILHAKAGMKNITLNLDAPSDLPSVFGYGGELNQVWEQLVDNAIDAAPHGGQISVGATHDGNAVVVEIVDNGPGIPEELQEKIFEPFYTTKPVGQGTGLGLDIAQRIVRWHNGELTLQSQPGRTEFRVRLLIHRI